MNYLILFAILFGGFLAWGTWLSVYRSMTFKMTMNDSECAIPRAWVSSETYRNYKPPVFMDNFEVYHNTNVIRNRSIDDVFDPEILRIWKIDREIQKEIYKSIPVNPTLPKIR